MPIIFLEYAGSILAVLGALFLALGFDIVGYMLFITSGLLLIPFCKLCNLNALLAMQAVFLLINFMGLYNRWLN